VVFDAEMAAALHEQATVDRMLGDDE